MNRHTTIKEAVFSVGSTLRLYNEDLMQLELQLSLVPRVPSEQLVESWALRREVRGDGSCSSELN
jgi:hypothetical protein